ncbi:MAG: Lacal_2735 family protein [Bacteroidia bacterium]|nr:Lacal_2735 family protein [Bacteroidia bacterium]
MFSFFKSNPLPKLEKRRLKMLEEAMHIQRSGDLKKYAFHMESIDKLEKEIEALRLAKH